MKIKTSTLVTIVIIALAVFVFATTLIHAVWYAPELDVYVPDATSTTPHVVPVNEQPTRLQIPSLNIDANVQYVGVSAAGNMGVPNNFTDVAWYKYGTVPGEKGSAVIDGHVDNGLSLAGVFKHLSDIKVGDDVYVQRKDGTKAHFVVYDIETYPYKSVPSEQIFNKTDGSYLNLITCEGAWVQSGRTYDHRLIVYTKLVS